MKSVLNTNIDSFLYLHFIPIFLLAIIGYIPGIILRAVVFFLIDRCWPLMWRWNTSLYKTPGVPIVLNETCNSSFFWPMMSHIFSDVVAAFIVGALVFYLWAALRNRLQKKMSHILKNIDTDG